MQILQAAAREIPRLQAEVRAGAREPGLSAMGRARLAAQRPDAVNPLISAILEADEEIIRAMNQAHEDL